MAPEGSIVGIEQSPEMLERARARAAENGWNNIGCISASVEEASIPIAADAALFHFTHDIMRTPSALANVVSHLKPGARIVAAGLKWAPVRAMPLNLLVWNAAMRSTSTLEGLARPWSHLEPLMQELEVEQMLGGTVYVASGVVKQRLSFLILFVMASRGMRIPNTGSRRRQVMRHIICSRGAFYCDRRVRMRSSTPARLNRNRQTADSALNRNRNS